MLCCYGHQLFAANVVNILRLFPLLSCSKPSLCPIPAPPLEGALSSSSLRTPSSLAFQNLRMRENQS